MICEKRIGCLLSYKHEGGCVPLKPPHLPGLLDYYDYRVDVPHAFATIRALTNDDGNKAISLKIISDICDRELSKLDKHAKDDTIPPKVCSLCGDTGKLVGDVECHCR